MSSKKLLPVLSVISFLLFIYFSYLVHKGVFHQLDFDTTVRFQDHIPRKVDLPFSIISLLGSAEITSLIWLIILIVTLIKKFWRTAVLLMLFPISQLLELYGKTYVYHPAPPFLFYRGVLPFNFPSTYVQTNYSYPSGHATRLTFLVVFIVLLLNTRFTGVKKLVINCSALIFLILVYISRVYLAEH